MRVGTTVVTKFRSQRILLAMALCLLAATKAYSLGLGEMQVTSVINEPLAATIPVLNADGVQRSELIVALGSNADYEATGVSWDFTHSELQFDVATAANGELVVNVTSSRPIREPYLNMLVQARWPAGRLLMEYTVLLDFPVFSGQSSSASTSGSSSSSVASAISATPAAQSTPVVAPAPEPAPAPAPSQTPIPRLVSGAPTNTRIDTLPEDQFRIQNGDTLWSLGGRVAQDLGVSRHQAMLAIRETNPDVFIRGDINMLRSGSVVRMPSRDAALARTEAQAIADFSQVMAGGALADVTPLQSRVTDFRNEGAASQAGTAQFRLTAGNQAEAGIAGSSVDALEEENQSLSDTNAALEEELAAARIANRDLTERLQNLEEQIAVMEALIEVENNEIRAVQEAVTTVQPVVQPVTSAVVQEQSLMGRLMSWLPLLGLVLVGLLAGAYLLIRRQRSNSDGFEDTDYAEDAAPFGEDSDEMESESGLQGDAELDNFAGHDNSDSDEEVQSQAEAGDKSIGDDQPENDDDDWGSDFDDLDSFFNEEEDLEDEQLSAEDESEESEMEKTLAFDATAMVDLEGDESESDEADSDDGLEFSANVAELDESLSEQTDEQIVEQESADSVEPDEVEIETQEENILDFSLDEESLDLPEGSPETETTADQAEDDAFAMDFDLDIGDLPAQDSAEPESEDGSDEDENTLSFDISELDLPKELASDTDVETEIAAEPESEIETEQEEDAEVSDNEEAEHDLSDFSFDDLDDETDEAEDTVTEDLDSLLEDLDDSLEEVDSEADTDEEVESFLSDMGLDETKAEDSDGLSLDEELELPDLDDDVDDLLNDFTDSDMDEDDDSLGMSETEESETKLELASAYMEMGDNTGAKELLDEVIRDGDESSKAKAQVMLDSIS